MTPQDILTFWFSAESEPYWFAKSDAFDANIRAQFLAVWQQAAAGELYPWRATLKGRLAEIIVLDQFSRNLHRGSPLAFAQDGMALVLAQEAMQQDGFAAMPMLERKFMPRRAHTLRNTPKRSPLSLKQSTKPLSTALAATRTATPSWGGKAARRKSPSYNNWIPLFKEAHS